MAQAPTQEAVQQYNTLIQEIQTLTAKIAELEMDRNEHILVEETLAPLDGSRRAYRLVGEVLVERTVEEVRPSIATNRQGLDETIATLKARAEEKQKAAAELKAKYNLQTESR